MVAAVTAITEGGRANTMEGKISTMERSGSTVMGDVCGNESPPPGQWRGSPDRTTKCRRNVQINGAAAGMALSIVPMRGTYGSR